MTDYQSQTWHVLRKWAEEQLAKARARNDAMLPPEETAMLRGEIRMLKKFLDLPQQAARGVAVEPVDE